MVPAHGFEQPFPLRRRQNPAFFHPIQEIPWRIRRVSRTESLPFHFEPLDPFGRNRRSHVRREHHVPDQIVTQLGNPARVGLVPHVHVFIDLPPAHTARHGARTAGLRNGPGDSAAFQFRQEFSEAVQIELVLETGAPGLEEHRKIFVRQNGIHQLLGSKPTHPQRHAFIEFVAGQQKGAPAAFSETSTEKTGLLEPAPQQRFHRSTGYQAEKLIRTQLVRQNQGNAVIAGEQLDTPPEAGFPCSAQSHAKRPVHPAAPDRMQYDLISGNPSRSRMDELDQQVMPVRQGASCGFFLFLEEADQLPGRRSVHTVFLLQNPDIVGIIQTRIGFLEETGDTIGEMKTPVVFFSPPERCGHGLRMRGNHEHVVVGDALDVPVLCANGDNLSDPGFPYELLVQFSDPRIGVLAPQMEISPSGIIPPEP